MSKLEDLMLKRDELREQLSEINCEIQKEHCNEYLEKYKDKYIFFEKGIHEDVYMYVDNIWYSVSDDTFFFEGMTFFGETGEYRDLCSFECAAWNQLAFNGRLIKDCEIREITKEEFVNKFNKFYSQGVSDFYIFLDKK